LASDARLTRYFHGQQTATVEAQPNLDAEAKYRLQERCADRAKIFHQEEYAEVEQGLNQTLKERKSDFSILTIYQSHYNARFNKCFIWAQTKYPPKTTYSMSIQDVNTRQQYAYYANSSNSPSNCMVSGIACKSESEWWTLVKPYIEELASF
jgi:hypothetical protein